MASRGNVRFSQDSITAKSMADSRRRSRAVSYEVHGMNPDDFNHALRIALRYFVMLGLRDAWLVRPLGMHIHNLYHEGETRPLMLANRAIQRMERQLEAEMEIRTEQLEVTFVRNA
jgi:hypothetical protein